MKSIPFVILATAACGHGHGNSPDAPPPVDAVVIPQNGVDLPLVSLGAFSYTVSLGLGEQYFSALVDTGSSSVGVAASSCTSCTGLNPLYKPGTTAADAHMTAMTTYADGSSWSGEIYKDGAALTGLPTVGLDFVAITAQNMFFSMNSYQAILGLGPSALLETGTTSFPDLESAATVPEIYAFRMCQARGDMWVGGFDPSAAATAVQYTPMRPIDPTNQPFYAVQIADVGFGAALGQTAAAFGDVLVDTGTSVSMIPTPVENMMLAQVNGNAAFKALFGSTAMLADSMTGSCVTKAGVTAAMVDAMLPPMTVKFPLAAGGTFSVDVKPTGSYLSPAGNGMFCWGFTSSGVDATAGSLIGDTLLVGMFTVFDITNKQIGFAPQQGCAPAMSVVPGREVRPDAQGFWFEQSPYFRSPHIRPAHATGARG